jgi:hypothetical protein
MRHETLTLAVAALLAIVAGGAVAAPTPAAATSPAADVQPSNHTVEVVDPDDRLAEQEIAELRRLAWGNDEVRQQFEDADGVHFHVEAVGESLEVYVASDENAPPGVVAEISLDGAEVTDVRTLNNAVTADSAATVELTPLDESAVENGSTVTVRTASGATTLSVENGTAVEAVAVTSVDDGNGSATFRTEADN